MRNYYKVLCSTFFSASRLICIVIVLSGLRYVFSKACSLILDYCVLRLPEEANNRRASHIFIRKAML